MSSLPDTSQTNGGPPVDPAPAPAKQLLLHPHHHCSCLPVYHPQLHHHQHHQLQPQTLPSSSHDDPDTNPSVAVTNSALPSSAAESGNLLFLPPPDQYAPANPYAPRGGYYDTLCPQPYAYTAEGPGPTVATPGVATSAAILHQGVDPQSYAAIVPIPIMPVAPTILGPSDTQYGGNLWLHPASQLLKKHQNGKKKIKVVQTVQCEVCKIECNTEEVLKIHKQGKKHKKNLQKLQESITAKPTTAQSEHTSSKRRIATADELEAKKRRLLEGGAAAEGVKVCTFCNVVVNSQTVFDSHLAGQKHAAMVKKQQEEQNRTGSQFLQGALPAFTTD